MSTAAAPTAAPNPSSRIGAILASNTYTIFILVLTIFSLTLMVVQVLLVQGSPTYQLVNTYDNLICVIFLIDFAMHLIHEPIKRDYFIGQRGYLDLLGSIPSIGLSQYTVFLRLFRLSRLFRLRRLMNPENRKLLKQEILDNRGSYALFFTLLLVGLVIMTTSNLVLFFESKDPDANITTGGNAVWWSFVTITTVGYGDFFPVTPGGRITAVFVMFAGVGIIGALASILASILVPQPKQDNEESAPPPPASPAGVEQELAQVKGELITLRLLIEQDKIPKHDGS